MKKLHLFIFFLFTTIALQAQKQKVILDCDLGDDIDDAFAVALMLSNTDKFEILGITTCYGRTNDRAEMACKMLYETGLEKIPVAMGRNTSNTDERANWYAEQYYWSKGFNKVKPIQQSGADFIIEQLHKYPNEVILFSVGPVTNMKDIIEKDPQALKLAKKIIAMFGSFYIGYNGSPTINPEWNVKVDIEASKKFVNSGANIVYAGLDITTFVKWNKANQERLLYRQSVLTSTLCGLTTLWSNTATPTLFDAVAIGMALYPDLFKTEKVFIEVDDKGYTRIDKTKTPNAEIGVGINTDEFLKRIMDAYLKQNLGR
ncbi:nucleoside hydrolase [Emticicia sp. SJ17W-69]|uniref:nucleoside hydrolase n=1 Tax=Emticicia sp. SJ17W-69 TaxID=3421657 RepID=UPI003EBB68B8